jgi:hypothetical protein
MHEFYVYYTFKALEVHSFKGLIILSYYNGVVLEFSYVFYNRLLLY